jgi:hypothetical protein
VTDPDAGGRDFGKTCAISERRGSHPPPTHQCPRGRWSERENASAATPSVAVGVPQASRTRSEPAGIEPHPISTTGTGRFRLKPPVSSRPPDAVAGATSGFMDRLGAAVSSAKSGLLDRPGADRARLCGAGVGPLAPLGSARVARPLGHWPGTPCKGIDPAPPGRFDARAACWPRFAIGPQAACRLDRHPDLPRMVQKPVTRCCFCCGPRMPAPASKRRRTSIRTLALLVPARSPWPSRTQCTSRFRCWAGPQRLATFPGPWIRRSCAADTMDSNPCAACGTTSAIQPTQDREAARSPTLAPPFRTPC